MFATLRCGTNEGLQIDWEQPAHHLARRPACKNCHSKKLRCTRERNGCRRCASSKITCEYNSSRPKLRRKRGPLDQITTCDARSEPAFVESRTSEAEPRNHTAGSDDQNRNLLDAAIYSPEFRVDHNLFDFLDASFGDPFTDPLLSYSRTDDLGSSHSETTSSNQALRPCESLISCQCLVSAVSLLESISIHYVQLSLRSVPQIIRYNKRALLECRALQSCKECSKKSEFVMLLILLCQKIVSSYQRTVIILTEQFHKLHRPTEDGLIRIPAMETVMATAREVDHSLVREYEVEVEEEPCVFGGLVQMQIKKMGSFLATLKVMVAVSEWSSHTAMVDLVGNDLKELVRMCRCPDGF